MILVRVFDKDAPSALQEPKRALDGLRRPRLIALQRTHKHLVQAQGIGPVLLYDHVGIDDVAARLGHLLAIFAKDHALMYQALKRLADRDQARIKQDLGPKPRI